MFALPATTLRASEAPLENPYDVLGKMFRPFFSVFFREGRDPHRAMAMTMRIAGIEGRLPKDFEGAVLRAHVEFPDKVKLEAPVLGEDFTVCRNGNDVWATPGSKMEFLLNQFTRKPGPSPETGNPLFVPITAQQAVFVVALFAIAEPNVAEVDVLNGIEHRVLSGGLVPDLAKSAQAEDFSASVWVSPDYHPARVEIRRKDFSVLVDIEKLEFGPRLAESVWNPPPGAEDVYRTDAPHLEQLLYVVMNSLQSEPGTEPWRIAR